MTSILVYESVNDDQGAIDTYNKIATDNLAKSVSTSWGLPEDEESVSDRNSENTIFSRMADAGLPKYLRRLGRLRAPADDGRCHAECR